MNPNIISRTINGWTYELHDNGYHLDFKILPNPEKIVPNSLFKYYGLSENSIESLKKERFYLAQPHEFNDLFDASFSRLDFEDISIDFAKRVIISLNEEEIDLQWKNEKKRIIDRAHYDCYKRFISMVGLLCMTSNHLDELMWGYYTNNEGFCLEFDYKKFGNHFKGPHPINYLEDLNPIPINWMDANFSFITLMTTKKKSWQHENEYRFLVEPSAGINFKTTDIYKNSDGTNGFVDRFESYDSDALKSITLGFNFLKDEEFEINDESTYEISFISKNGILKREIFEIIAKKNLKCFCLTQQLRLFKFGIEEWQITLISNNKFKVIRLK